MLSIFRRGFISKIMLVILGIGLLAIVVTGFGTDGMGGLGGVAGGASGDTLASVEGERITSSEINDQVDRQLSRAREQQPELDIGNFLNTGAYEEILRQLIDQKAMLAFATDNGFVASKRMIDGEIASVPAFKNLAGQFDQSAFQSALQRERITEAQLRKDLAASLIQRQLLLPVGGSARVPDSMAQQYASLLLEQRSGTVGLVPAAAMGVGREPTDSEVAAFYRENQGRYTIPERRVLRYAMIGPEQVAGAARATDAEIAAAYQANQERYGAKETRTLSQVILPNQQAAQAFAARVAGGTSFAAAAGANLIAVENQTRAQFTNLTTQAIANAAYSAAQGAVTGPLQSPLGWHVVRVESIQRTPATPLAAVRPELQAQVSQRKQADALAGLITKVEDALGEGSSFEEVARANGLAIQETPPITATGAQPGVPAWRPAPELAPLLRPAFDMMPDDDPVVETVAPNERYAVVGVGRIIPAAPPPLPQVAAAVKSDLIQRRAAERARAVATALVAKINAGVPAAQAFAEAGVKLPAPERVQARRIDIAQPNRPVPPPLAMMFSLPKGKARLLPAPAGQGWFVVHLENTAPGDARNAAGLVQSTKVQFQRFLGQEYADQFSRAIQTRYKVERNEDSIRKTKQQLLRGAAPQ
jgi:peptidyl-prolyl cis-trans isomerase D